ncbi:MAG: hypothetical protein JXA21_13625 [Anaerolineae bacterium]|nr:hypothetical protein [Anaerolineae bacterium]
MSIKKIFLGTWILGFVVYVILLFWEPICKAPLIAFLIMATIISIFVVYTLLRRRFGFLPKLALFGIFLLFALLMAAGLIWAMVIDRPVGVLLWSNAFELIIGIIGLAFCVLLPLKLFVSVLKDMKGHRSSG